MTQEEKNILDALICGWRSKSARTLAASMGACPEEVAATMVGVPPEIRPIILQTIAYTSQICATELSDTVGKMENDRHGNN